MKLKVDITIKLDEKQLELIMKQLPIELAKQVQAKTQN